MTKYINFVIKGAVMTIEIIGTGRAIPSTRITNEDLAKQNKIDTNDEWIRSHTGIGARHIADENTAASDLALVAAKNAIAMAAEKSGESAESIIASIDIIVCGTLTQDFIGFPSTACIVQGKLGAVNAGAFDISAGCTAFVYGLEMAQALLSVNKNRKRALVIGSEVLSKIVNWEDRSTCVLFGDGAGAVLIEKTDAPAEGLNRRGIVRSILAADGTGTEHLILRKGGSRNPFKNGEIVDIAPHVEMNGQAVYNFAVKVMTKTIEDLLAQDGITIDDVARIVPHQANARIVQAAAKRLHIPEEKFYLNIEEYANTSGASIPIALDELNRAGELNRGDLIMTLGFGAGLTYGGNLIVW
jgi:3-oxoacyl-[acyl-carrier-protein] synthase-3